VICLSLPATAADVEGEKIVIPLGLEKPSQSFVDKYPELITAQKCPLLSLGLAWQYGVFTDKYLELITAFFIIIFNVLCLALALGGSLEFL